MTVPSRLNEWTHDVVATLCADGLGEGDRHDFKAALQGSDNTTKICCAFANSYGGFLVYGVAERNGRFSIEGVDRDNEFFTKLRDQVRAEPAIDIAAPAILPIPGSTKVLYVFHVTRSQRRPHLPNRDEKRFFWKRSGPKCDYMSLEEIRFQMLDYDAKLEKLVLMAFDLRNKGETLKKHAGAASNEYFGDTFQFDIIDRVFVEAYALLRDAPEVLIYWERLKQMLMLFNFEKQKLMSILATSYTHDFKVECVDKFTALVKDRLAQCESLIGAILQRLKDLHGVEVPV